MPDENGTWHLNEDEVAFLRQTQTIRKTTRVRSSLNGTLTFGRELDRSSIGGYSNVAVSWNTSGMHTVQVERLTPMVHPPKYNKRRS